MQYGYFDEKAREYVITNPNTPAPWANYLGSPAYGAIVTQNAGGYSFVKSGAAGRILRYSFNQFDEPGRYLYLRDRESGDFWSAAWRPVEKPLSEYKTVCRHGTAYTEIESEYSGIKSSVLYYVPKGATHEVWRLRLKNESGKKREISVFTYCEFTCESLYHQDLVNLQYTQFITRTSFEGDFLLEHINENCHVGANGENGSERFLGLAGAKVESYTGRREQFLGRNRFDKPQAVIDGKCDNTLNYNGNPCGSLQTTLVLEAGEEKEIAILLAQYGKSGARKLLDSYKDVHSTVEKEKAELISYWHGELSALHIETPDENFNAMVNTWNAFQCFTTFVWSRAASLIYCGDRNGYGYRDTVQDIQGIIHLDPEMAKKQITFMLSAQVHRGAGLPLVKYTHNAGHEDTPEQESYVRETGHPHYRADDALWLFPTVFKYVAETGNTDYLSEVIPFADKDEGTVLEHLKRAIDFSMTHSGPHGMPAGLHADWNDCLRLGAQGESTFCAFQLYYAMAVMQKLCIGDTEYQKYLAESMEKLKAVLMNDCFEGDRFIRGITEWGQIIGSKKDPEASMWLNPQSWAVISGAVDEKIGDTVMDSVEKLLNTKYGVVVMAPPYEKHAFDGANMLLFNPYTKENGGVFCQPQGWAILAEGLLGRGENAFRYFKESSPSSFNDNADLRVIEPYVHGQFIEGAGSPMHGRAHVHWLTGTATTVMVGCVEGILGLRPDVSGITISPAIPADWDGFKMTKQFRGHTLEITVDNKAHKQGKPSRLTLNGIEMQGLHIPADKLGEKNEIVVIM